MSSPPLSALGQVIAHARMGALDEAWRLFRAAGLEGVADDAAVLSVKGRLFKDEARRAPDEASRRALFARAAEAYGQAGAIAWATYPLINAASLSLLSGDEGRARALAERVLARLDQGDREPDTPYWREATRAEAQLLLGATHEAWLTLQGALELAPRAWEDHAATLRQFSLILAERGEDDAWLAPLRPPRVLHYVGPLGAPPDDAGLKARIAEILETERIGFAWGALAAGADILIAEALLARGAELNIVLPAPRAAFRAASVAPMGGDWPPRFDAVLQGAAQVLVAPGADDPPTELSARLAALTAMGRAVLQAEVLSTEAVQLALTAGAGDSRADQDDWSASGRRQLDLAAAASPPPAAAALPAGAGRVLAVLAVVLSADALVGEAAAAALAEQSLPALGEAMRVAGLAPAAPIVWTGRAVAIPLETAAAATALSRALGHRLAAAPAMGAALGLVRQGLGPSGETLSLGPAIDAALRLAQAAEPATLLADPAFAAALAIAAAPGAPPPCQPAGELPPPPAADPEADAAVFSVRL